MLLEYGYLSFTQIQNFIVSSVCLNEFFKNVPIDECNIVSRDYMSYAENNFITYIYIIDNMIFI